MLNKSIALLLTFAFLLGCGSSDSTESTVGADTDPSTSTKYKITFSTNWDSTNFSTNFPANRHFSGLVGATHNQSASIWANNKRASDGIRSMAETGSKLALMIEMKTLKSSGKINQAINEDGIPSSQPSISFEITATKEFPLLTLVSMVAPSPDWFVGIHDYQLLENGEWINQATIDLIVYDAGTDEGVSFTSPNSKSNSPANIKPLTSNQADTDFNEGIHFSSGTYIGSLTITKL